MEDKGKVLASPSGNHIFMEGVLRKKKKGPLGGFVERWYRLVPQGLFYYKTTTRPAPGSPASFVDISTGKYFKATFVVRKQRLASEEPGIPAVEIKLESRVLLLACGSMEERGKWLRALSKWQSTHRKDYAEVTESAKTVELDEDDIVEVLDIEGDEEQDDKEQEIEELVGAELQAIAEALRGMAVRIVERDCSIERQKVLARAALKKLALTCQESFYEALCAEGLLTTCTTSLKTSPTSPRFSHIIGDQLGRTLEVLSLSSSTHPKVTSTTIMNQDLVNFEQNERIRSNIFSVIDRKYWELLNTLAADNFTTVLELCERCENSLFDRTAHSLIHMFELMNCSSDFLGTVIQRSVDETKHEGTLFRNNTVPSKMISYYVKDHGSFYLEEVLQGFLGGLSRIPETMSFEINPNKLECPEDASVHLVLFKKYLEDLIKLILASIDSVPLSVRKVAFHISKYVAVKFPGSEVSAIGGMFFLRFMNPAILSPYTYNLVRKEPSVHFRRNLIMIAKVFQNMSNGVPFGQKEPHMAVLNEFIQSYQKRMDHFLRQLANISEEYFCSDFESVTKADCDAAEEDCEFLLEALLEMGAISEPLFMRKESKSSKESSETASKQKTKPRFFRPGKKKNKPLRMSFSD